ncbi:hypothetical protein JCM6882_005911 [Rhodosporidiobolus microsporus]
MASPVVRASSFTLIGRRAGSSTARFSSFSSIASVVLPFSSSSESQTGPTSVSSPSTKSRGHSIDNDADTASIEDWNSDLPLGDFPSVAFASTSSATPSLSTSSTSVRSTSSASSLASDKSAAPSTSGTSLASTSSRLSTSSSISSSRRLAAKAAAPRSSHFFRDDVDPLRNSIPFPRIGTTPALIRRGGYRNPSAVVPTLASTVSDNMFNSPTMARPLKTVQATGTAAPPSLLLRKTGPVLATAAVDSTWAPAMYSSSCQKAPRPTSVFMTGEWQPRRRTTSTFRRF